MNGTSVSITRKIGLKQQRIHSWSIKMQKCKHINFACLIKYLLQNSYIQPWYKNNMSGLIYCWSFFLTWLSLRLSKACITLCSGFWAWKKEKKKLIKSNFTIIYKHTWYTNTSAIWNIIYIIYENLRSYFKFIVWNIHILWKG